MITTSLFEKRYIEEQLQKIEAKRIVEIGVFKGQTTAVLSRVAARHKGYVVAVDPMKWASQPASLGERFDRWFHPYSYEPAFWRSVRNAPNVILQRCLSSDTKLIADPSSELQEFDAAFIDGEHTYEAALRDLHNWGTRVRPGGLILMHDVRSRFPGVQRAFDEFSRSQPVKTLWPRRGSVGILEVLRPLAQQAV